MNDKIPEFYSYYFVEKDKNFVIVNHEKSGCATNKYARNSVYIPFPAPPKYPNQSTARCIGNNLIRAWR